MIDPYDFAKKQSELAAEFAKYVLDHPEIDDSLPENSHSCHAVSIFFDFTTGLWA